MTRNRASAKKAGTAFETATASHASNTLLYPVERRTLTGGKDRGDLAGLYLETGERFVVQVKNVTRQALPAWLKATEEQRVNDGAAFGVCVHKRHGVGAVGDQYVTSTYDMWLAQVRVMQSLAREVVTLRAEVERLRSLK